jgi:SAM-dependent methyltransferase
MSEQARQIAALYDWRHSIGHGVRSYKPIADADIELIARHHPIEGAKVADFGCGGGTHLQALVRAGARYPLGIDVSSGALAAAARLCSNDSVLLMHGDWTRWKLTGAFQIALCSLPPVARRGNQRLTNLIRRLAESLSPDGLLFLKVFTRERVSEIIGTYSVVYDGSATKLHSRVELLQGGSVLKIRQNAERFEEDEQVEYVALPRRRDVRTSLSETGMRLVNDRAQMSGRLPGTDIMIARKS